MRLKLIALIAAPVAVLTLGGPAAASHSWGNYHWARTANPFTLQVGDNVNGVWDGHLDTAIGDWSQSTVLDLVKVAGSSRSRNCKATAGRIEVCNGAYGNNGWLGIASISITGGTHITSGTTKVNDTYFNTAKYNTPAWRNVVMCQEVGHDFGLDHQDENFGNADLGTCMDYSNNPTPNQHPNAHDYQQLETIYSHLDSTSTVGSTTAAQGLDQVGADASSWGREVAGSRASGRSTFVREFGPDNLVVTHVIWAE